MSEGNGNELGEDFDDWTINELDNLDQQPRFESTGREKCTDDGDPSRHSQLWSQLRVTATQLLKKRRHGRLH